jgi:hypothetical protein
MKSYYPVLASLLGVVLCSLPIPAQAQYLDQIGVTLLRATTTNLNGSGIRVAQPEAGYGSIDNWQVNPSVVGQPTNLFTYISSNGAASTFTNSLGLESGHADDVGNQFYGIPNGVATNAAHVDNFEVNNFLNNYVFSSPTHSITDAVVNQSFSFGPQSASVQQTYDSLYDNYSATYKVLFVSAADNFGNSYPNSTNVALPGTAYNCISVGAYKNGLSYNSVGPTIDNGRCKPDITAYSDATSYTTPQVSGAAAVLMQAALRGDGGSDTNSAFDMRTIKALLLNGAMKQASWTNSTSSPLDARFGAGLLNLFNSYKQLAGGKSGYVVSNSVSTNAPHLPTGAAGTVVALSGWNYTTNISGRSNIAGSQFDTIHHYYFNISNSVAAANFIATATLVWNRQANQSAINNLNLFLYNCANSNLVLCSTSLVDNVEHLYVTNLAQGRYDLQVWKAGGNNTSVVSAAEPYALAWQFTPVPTLALTNAGTNLNLTWPIYPAGFQAEANTNLLLTNGWSASSLPMVVFTNGLNSIPVNPTNAAQFFRLHQSP